VPVMCWSVVAAWLRMLSPPLARRSSSGAVQSTVVISTAPKIVTVLVSITDPPESERQEVKQCCIIVKYRYINIRKKEREKKSVNGVNFVSNSGTYPRVCYLKTRGGQLSHTMSSFSDP
jgi:hypothetical protein